METEKGEKRKMTGDRILEENELNKVTQEEFALKTIVNEGGEPSLYDVAFIETSAKLSALKDTIIDIYRRLKILEMEREK